jgi:hypothetical protein
LKAEKKDYNTKLIKGLVRTRFDCETRTGFIRNLEDYETLKWFRVLVRNSKRSRKVPRYPIGFV